MAKKKVFVSFDYTNDKGYKYLLDAWDKNKNMDFVFDDRSAGEIMSNNIPTVKAGLTKRIKDASYTLVIIGKEANKKHKKRKKIGHKNWINFEIAQSIQNGNKLVAVKLNRAYEPPEELLSAGAFWAMSFTQDAIIKALNKAAHG